jgi:hypothetical protein
MSIQEENEKSNLSEHEQQNDIEDSIVKDAENAQNGIEQ